MENRLFFKIDLKSLAPCERESSILSPGTICRKRWTDVVHLFFYAAFRVVSEIVTGNASAEAPCLVTAVINPDLLITHYRVHTDFS